MRLSRVIQYSIYLVELLTFILIYWLVFHGPMHDDETGWLIQNAHILYDNYRMISQYPTCVSTFSWPVPWPLMPGRVFASLLHPDTLIVVRIYGMIKYAACIGMLSWLGYILFEKQLSWLTLLAVTTSILSMGFLPSIMIFNRPETDVLLGISELSVLALLSGNVRQPYWRYICCGMFLCILSWFFSIHPKAQFFSPAIALLAYRMVKNFFPAQRLYQAVFLISVAGMMVACVQLWAVIQVCPDSLRASFFLNAHTLLLRNFFENPSVFMRDVLINLGTMDERFLLPLGIGNKYLGSYPANHTHLDPDSLVLHGANLGIRFFDILIISFFLISLLASLHTIKNKKSFLPCMSYCLLLPVFIVMATKRNIWSYWEIGFLLYLICFVMILLIRHLNWHRTHTVTLRWVIVCISCIAILSHLALYNSYKDFYLDVADAGAHPNGDILPIYVEQGIFDEAERNPRIVETAALCHIPINENTPHLVLDDWTYMALHKTFQPFYAIYLFWNPPDHESILAFLKERGSAGAITLCQSMPPELRSIATENHGICCVKTSQ